MTVTVEQLPPRRRLLVALLAAVLALVAAGAGTAADAHASSRSAADVGNGVAAHDHVAGPVVAASAGIAPGQGRRTTTAEPGTVVGSRVAPQTARAVAGVADDALPAALRGGAADVHVYYGVSNGKNVYVGITNDIARRQAQHGSRFVLDPITASPVTRGQARAIEEALFMRNPGFQNIRHPISPSHSWYDDALDWGNAWLRNNGL